MAHPNNRLCSLSLVQIILDRPIEPECANTGFYVVVRMRGTARRVLRSPEITLICSKSPQAQVVSTNAHSNNLSTNPNEVGHSESTGQPCANTSLNASVPGGGGGGGSVLIDFTCNIQYSHLLTRDSNTLQILLQRRKKYKSKAMNLGYKTLAYCNVNLAQVLQRRIENRFLDLYTDPKCSTLPVGRIEVLYLSSSPIEKDLLNGKRKVVDEDEDYPLPDVYSEQDDSDHGEESDEDQMAECEMVGHSRQKKLVKAMSVGQKQIKQKLIGLLKKLKIGDPNEVDLDVAATSKLWDEIDRMATVSDIEEDSDAESINLVSIQSTPRPTLRPFFATAGSSDDTLSADAGAKLLKRLQRELLSQSETDTSPDTIQLRSMLASVGKSVNLQKPFGKSVDKSAGLLQLEHNSPPLQPPSSSSTITYTDTIPLQSNDSSSSRIHRGGGSGHGMSLAGGRFAKRFAHIRRRSNTNSSAKQIFGVSRSSKSNYRHNSEATVQEMSNIPLESESSDDHSPTDAGLELSSPRGQNSVFDHIGLHDSDLSEVLSAVCSTPDANRTHCSRDRGVSDGNLNFSIDESRIQEKLLTNSISDFTNGGIKYSEASSHCADKNRFKQISMEPNISDIEKLANVTFIVSGLEKSGKLIHDLLSEWNLRLISVNSFSEMRTVFTRLANESSQSHTRRILEDGDFIKVCILGGNQLINLVLRAYVDQLSCRSTELAASFRFFIIPIDGVNKLLHATTSLSLSSTLPYYDQINSMKNGIPINSSFGGQQNINDSPSNQLNLNDSNSGRASLSSIQTTYFNNLFAYHLCQIDPIYGKLFKELCDESGSIDHSDHNISVSNLTNKEYLSVIRLELLNRIIRYVIGSRNMHTFPIGACLLGSSKHTNHNSSSNTSTSGSKIQKSLTTDCSSTTTTSGNTSSTNSNITNQLSHGVLDQCASHSDGTSCLAKGSSVPDTPTHSEEMVIPFILNVRLGNCSALAYPGLSVSLPMHPKTQQQQQLGKSLTGDNSASSQSPNSTNVANTNATELDSKTPSDPEQSHTKRNISPESTSHGTFTSPRIRRNFSLSFRSSKKLRKRKSSWTDGANSSSTTTTITTTSNNNNGSTNINSVLLHGSHSSTQRSGQSPVFGSDQRLWDIQVEYWSIPSHTTTTTNTSSNSSTQSNQVNTVSGSASNTIVPCPISSPSTISDTVSPPRRSTLKTLSPGLVVTIDSSISSASYAASPLRGGDIFGVGTEPNSSSVVHSPLRHTPFNLGQTHSQHLVLGLWTKEKKQKIMLIGRKGKGFSCRYELINGIQRLLCTGRGCNFHNTSLSTSTTGGSGGGGTSGTGGTERTKDTESSQRNASSIFSSSVDSSNISPSVEGKASSSISALGLALTGGGGGSSGGSGGNSGFGINTANTLMRVSIDGVEWTNLKFFQITPVWRTHVKFFPVALLNNTPIIGGDTATAASVR